MIATRWAWTWPWLTLGAVRTAGATFSTAPVTDVKALAGGWQGWVDDGRGGSRLVTVTLAENGAFEAVADDGGRTTGFIVLKAGRLRWSDTSGASGPMRLSAGDGKRVLQGRRADGSASFEWTQPGRTGRTP